MVYPVPVAGDACQYNVQCSQFKNDIFNSGMGMVMRLPNPVLGCCGIGVMVDGVLVGKTCTLYTDKKCDGLQNRPLNSPCANNLQCADSCCSLEDDVCVAPLLNCKNQIPLWLFMTILGAMLAIILLAWKITDHYEKKDKKAKRQQRKLDKRLR